MDSNGYDLDLDLEVVNGENEKTVLLKLGDGVTSVDDDNDDGSVKEDPCVVKSKKSKKPPRPPGPISLDQKLIKELAQLRRARIKQKKNAAKILSSSSSSSHGSFLAMLFTIIFLLVILFQGQNSGLVTQHSPQRRSRSSLAVIQKRLNIANSTS